MNDIKKALELINSVETNKTLTESAIAECGDMGTMAAPVQQGNPVTASITLNASGMDHVADLMRLLQQAGIEKEGPPAPAAMPMRMDMERLRDTMSGLEKSGMESSLADDIEDSEIEEWENEPSEEYTDHKFMTKDLSGGINRPKKMFKPAAKGDNPMAVESIKDKLYRELSEKKAKPDFLDMDKDGDKKEPMKKAVADKKKNGPVKEAAKPDYIDLDKDGNKKEPMKKAAKDAKKKAPVKEGAAPYAPVYLQHLKQQFGDKKVLDRSDKYKIADIIKKSSIEHLKQLALANIPHVSNAAKNYIKHKTPGGMVRPLESDYNEAEFQAPTHELDDTARKAMAIAQKIKRKINSGEQMDDRDYNQMAELGAILSRFGTSFGPKSMKDVMAHMVQYTNDRNEEGHGYPEFNVNRFKELMAMASGKSESYASVSEISPDLAKRYTKAAKMDRDFNDDDIARLSKSGQSTQAMHRRNSKRTKGINQAKKRM